MTPDAFIAKWSGATLSERAAAQSHFLDLCALLGEPTPAEADSRGEFYCFERGATKTTGGKGWADVWKRGCFGWEYKGNKCLDGLFFATASSAALPRRGAPAPRLRHRARQAPDASKTPRRPG